MAETSLYDLLGVETTATPAEIKSAFRALALRSHPDQGGSPALFQLVEDAYETLSDPDKRAEYDRRTRVEPSFAGTHFSGFSEEERPTGEWDSDAWTQGGPETAQEPRWTADSWAYDEWDSGAWRGDQAAAWQDREPGAEPKPEYVIASGPLPGTFKGTAILAPMAVFSLLRRLHLNPFFFIFWGSVAWIGYAMANDFDAFPWISNAKAFLILLFAKIVWLYAPFWLRLLGYIIMALGIYQAIVYSAAVGTTVMLVGGGFLLWFVGNWWDHFKDGEVKSKTATSLFFFMPGILDPRWRHRRRDAQSA